MTEDGPHRHERGGKPKDPYHWHGQRIVTEEDLDSVFASDDDVERPQVYLRRLVHGLVLFFLLVALIAAVVAALAIARGELRVPFLETTVKPGPSCPEATYRYVPNQRVTVNVYNATAREGLAARVARQLKSRGYRIGEIGGRRISHPGLPAVIISGKAGEANALNLQRNILGTEYVSDDRTDATVDVVLGSGFKALLQPKRVRKVPGTLSCPRLAPPSTVSPAGRTPGPTRTT